MITTKGLEDKLSPSTPTASLNERSRPKAPYSSSEKYAHERCSPKTGQHMEYAGNVTHRVMNKIIAITTCNMAGGKLYGYNFA